MRPLGEFLRWSPDATAYVTRVQERAYRALADDLGLGGDPKRAYALLSRPPMPASHASTDNLKRMVRGTDTFTAAQWRGFDATVALQLEELYALENPTPYEDVTWYRSMALTLGMLQASIASSWATFEQPPLIGTVPSGDVNAIIFLVPGDGTPVVLFDQGLFPVLHQFAIVVGWGLPSVSLHELGDNAGLARLQRKYRVPERAVEYFAASLHAYVVGGSAKRNELSLEANEDNIFVTMALLQQMELFVMGHELAHLKLGHLGRAAADPREAWSQEYEADEESFALITTGGQRVMGTGAIAAWASDTLLQLLHILYAAVATLEYGTGRFRWASGTHPSFAERQRNIRQTLATMMPTLSWNELLAVDALSRMTQDMLNELWGRTLDRLKADHKRGVRPSPLWKQRLSSDLHQSSQDSQKPERSDDTHS